MGWQQNIAGTHIVLDDTERMLGSDCDVLFGSELSCVKRERRGECSAMRPVVLNDSILIGGLATMSRVVH